MSGDLIDDAEPCLPGESVFLIPCVQEPQVETGRRNLAGSGRITNQASNQIIALADLPWAAS